MSALRKRWIPAPTPQPELARHLGTADLTAALLQARGITTPEEAHAFLHPSLDAHTHDPLLMRDMRVARDRLIRAVREGEPLAIFGDFDTDGITAVSLLMRALGPTGARLSPYIPDRHTEGYGLNIPALQALAHQGVRLVITVDCGISNAAEITAVRDLGLDMVVTDHHTPPEVLPAALAVINPKREGCDYPDKHLAGVGIAYKLAQACADTGLAGMNDPRRLLDLVAVGSITDMAMMLGENRALVAQGMEELNATQLPGLEALVRAAGLTPGSVTSTDISFGIGPRLNAAGRIASPRLAYDLLTCNDPARADELADEINTVNRTRQQLIPPAQERALAVVADQGLGADRIVVVPCQDLPAGIIGLVAARLVEHLGRPVLLMNVDGASAHGSARSIAGFNIHAALTACTDLFTKFGGHAAAAGFSLPAEQVPTLRARLQELALELDPEALVPTLALDAEISLSMVTPDLLAVLGQFAPFGQGNPQPVLFTRNITATRPKAMGSEGKHLSFYATSPELQAAGVPPLRAVAWNLGHLAEPLGRHPHIDIAYTADINTWNGSSTLELKIKDFRRASA